MMPRLGIDVGGPLSVKDARGRDARQTPANMHTAVTPGAWPFVITFGMIHGFNNIFIISRVNNPQAGQRDST